MNILEQTQLNKNLHYSNNNSKHEQYQNKVIIKILPLLILKFVIEERNYVNM